MHQKNQIQLPIFTNVILYWLHLLFVTSVLMFTFVILIFHNYE